MDALRRFVLCLTPPLVAAAVSPPGAGADVALTTLTRATPVVADAGVTAWRIPTSGDDRLVVRYGDDTPFTTAYPLPRTTTIDVGSSPAGGARVAFARNCSLRGRACDVRVVELGRSGSERKRFSARLLTRIPYRGGGEPAVAVQGRRIAYTEQGSARIDGRRYACDVPYTRTTGANAMAPRRLDRGACSLISQLDIEDGRIAVLAHPQPDTRRSEARILRTTGGSSRRLQREAQGEESNFIGQVALDRGSLYTSRSGIRQANVFTRFTLRTGASLRARAFTSLIGGFARDRGRTTYVEGSARFLDTCSTSETGTGCRIVAGDDPFGARSRLLTPTMSFDLVPVPLYAEQTARGAGSLSRRRVTRTTQLGNEPVPGVRVELVRIDGLGTTTTTRHPTGATGTTDADGRFDIPISGTPRPTMVYSAITRPAVGQGLQVAPVSFAYAPVYVRMTVASQRLADGRLRVTGTIAPAVPGRRVRLDRREERVCNKGATIVGRPTPSMVDVPAGCVDRYTREPLATADVSADGTTFTLEAAAGAGTYRVSLNHAGADAYSGETVAFTVS